MTRALAPRLNDQTKRIDTVAARVDSLERSISAVNHALAELRATVNAFAGDNGYLPTRYQRLSTDNPMVHR